MNGDDKFYYQNDCNILINQGSIVIFEYDDTKKFKVFDFGDSPSLTVMLSKSKNFIGAAIGQYNKRLWDYNVLKKEIRQEIKPSVYPESCWNLGLENFEQMDEYRKSVKLDDRLYWRGSIYNTISDPNYRNTRVAIEHLSVKMQNFYFAPFPISFDNYISESLNFKLALCFGGGGGYSDPGIANGGVPGGCGGGGGGAAGGGTGTANQGYGGGTGGNYGGGSGGGGGAGSAGSGTTPGTGVSSSITGTAVTRSAGGGFSSGLASANTGRGGGGSSPPYGGSPQTGGSGVVIIRYPTTAGTITIGVGLTGSTTPDGADTVATFTAGSGDVSWA